MDIEPKMAKLLKLCLAKKGSRVLKRYALEYVFYDGQRLYASNGGNLVVCFWSSQFASGLYDLEGKTLTSVESNRPWPSEVTEDLITGIGK